MNADRFLELLPRSQVVARLNDLRDKAILAVKRVREQCKNEMFLKPLDFIQTTNRQLFQDVTDEGDIIGETRAIRIARKGTTGIYGVDHSVKEMDLDSSAKRAEMGSLVAS